MRTRYRHPNSTSRSTTRPSLWIGGTPISPSTKPILATVSYSTPPASASFTAMPIFRKWRGHLSPPSPDRASSIPQAEFLPFFSSPEPPFGYGDSQISVFAEIPDFVVPRKILRMGHPDSYPLLSRASWLRGLQFHHYESYRGLACHRGHTR